MPTNVNVTDTSVIVQVVPTENVVVPVDSADFIVQLSNLQGPQGIQGPAGANGTNGAAGPSNILSIGTVTTGGAGTAASATITGTSPSQVLNLTIPQGATGPSNSLSVSGVTTLAAGSSATVTITGTSPFQGISFGIPRGDTGAQGPAGPTGPSGPTGPAGANGTNGTSGVISVVSPITNTGTSSAAVLGFDATGFTKYASSGTFTQTNNFSVSQLFNAGITTSSNGATTNALLVKANTTANGGQTSAIIAVVGPNNEAFAGIGANGRLTLSSAQYVENFYNTSADVINIVNQGTTARSLFAQAGASQTGDIIRAVNNAGTVSAGVNKDGKLFGDGSLLTGITASATVASMSYTHSQASNATTWTITHNLGFRPNITVIESGGSVVEGDTVYTSANALTITFNVAINGTAYLS